MAELNVNPGTMIGFSANKTEEQAKADTTSNRMTICKEKVLYMNGQRLGLSESEAEYLKKKLDEEFASKVNLQVSLSKTVQDAAAPAAVTVTVYTRFNGALVDADAVPTITATGMTPTLTKSTTGTYTCTLEGKNTHVTVSVTAKIKGITKPPYSGTIYAYHKIRYGVSKLDALPAGGTIPENFKAVGPQGSAAGRYTFNLVSGSYGYILVPNGVSLPDGMNQNPPQGSEGPLPVLFTKLADLVVSGVTYRQFRMAAKQAESTHVVDF